MGRKATKRRFAAMVAVITLLWLPPATAFNFARTDAGQVPALTFLDSAGKERRLAEFRGKVVVLNLWATWCAPCREEMPSLDRLQASHGGKGLSVIALSLDRGPSEQVQAFLDDIKVENLELYHDPKAQAGRSLKAPGLPTTLLIDRQGNEIGRVLGDTDWDRGEALQLVEAMLKE